MHSNAFIFPDGCLFRSIIAMNMAEIAIFNAVFQHGVQKLGAFCRIIDWRVMQEHHRRTAQCLRRFDGCHKPPVFWQEISLTAICVRVSPLVPKKSFVAQKTRKSSGYWAISTTFVGTMLSAWST